MKMPQKIKPPETKSPETKVHLWVYNHPFHGISDQVEFFLAIMRQSGFETTVSRHPHTTAMNVVIENFSDKSAETLLQFCRNTNKRICVIMTEHLDFINREIHIHGTSLWRRNDYMHPATQAARIKSLMDCACHIRAFLVLGDLPQLINMDQMLPGIAVKTIPFPTLSPPALPTSWQSLAADAVFTGAITAHRAQILDQLSATIKMRHPDHFLSRHKRDAFSQTGKIVLNIPQREDWRWLSLMRVIAALNTGRATISLGTNDTSQIAACCTQLDITQPNWLTQLQSLTQHPAQLFQTAFQNYQTMAKNFAISHPFPHDFFDYWSITERPP